MASAALVTLAGQLNTVWHKTRLWGDEILANGEGSHISFPIELTPPWAYFHSGHGEETAIDHKGDPLRSMVPRGSAYMTNVRCGKVTMAGTDDYETIAFFSGTVSESIDIPPRRRMAFLEKCIRGERDAIVAAKPLFRPDAPDELAILPEGKKFVTSHFLPYFTYENPSAPGTFIAMQSGLLPYGTSDLGAEMEFVKYNEDVLRFMYKNSVFPTVDMVMKSGFRGVMGVGPNRDRVEGHLNMAFRCSSEALMLRFPGFHAHSVCRTPIVGDVGLGKDVARFSRRMARERIAATFYTKRTRFFRFIERYVGTCPWGDGKVTFPKKPAADPSRPTGLVHPDDWTTAQREHALEWAQQEHFKELEAAAAAGAGGGGGAAAAGGAGGGGAKRQRTRRSNRRSQRQRRNTRRGKNSRRNNSRTRRNSRSLNSATVRR